MSTLHAQSSNKALIYSMIQMKRGDPFFLHRWRLLGALTAIEISLKRAKINLLNRIIM